MRRPLFTSFLSWFRYLFIVVVLMYSATSGFAQGWALVDSFELDKSHLPHKNFRFGQEQIKVHENYMVISAIAFEMDANSKDISNQIDIQIYRKDSLNSKWKLEQTLGSDNKPNHFGTPYIEVMDSAFLLISPNQKRIEVYNMNATGSFYYSNTLNLPWTYEGLILNQQTNDFENLDVNDSMLAFACYDCSVWNDQIPVIYLYKYKNDSLRVFDTIYSESIPKLVVEYIKKIRFLNDILFIELTQYEKEYNIWDEKDLSLIYWPYEDSSGMFGYYYTIWDWEVSDDYIFINDSLSSDHGSNDSKFSRWELSEYLEISPKFYLDQEWVVSARAEKEQKVINGSNYFIIHIGFDIYFRDRKKWHLTQEIKTQIDTVILPSRTSFSSSMLTEIEYMDGQLFMMSSDLYGTRKWYDYAPIVYIYESEPCEVIYDTLSVWDCDSYTSPGNRTSSEDLRFTDTTYLPGGCYKFTEINLDLDYKTFDRIDTTVCGIYKSPAGNIYNYEDISFFDTLTNAAGCDSIIEINVDFISPNENITFNSSLGLLTADEWYAEYQWVDCFNNYIDIPGETERSFNPQEAGLYAVKIRTGDCELQSNCIYVTEYELSGRLSKDSIRVFPNPSTGQLNFKFSLDQSIIVSVFDSRGQFISKYQFQDIPRGSIKLPETTGVYFIEVEISSGRTEYFRILKY